MSRWVSCWKASRGGDRTTSLLLLALQRHLRERRHPARLVNVVDRPRPCVRRAVVTERRVNAAAVGIRKQHRDPVAVGFRVADSVRGECEHRRVVQPEDGILALLRVPGDIWIQASYSDPPAAFFSRDISWIRMYSRLRIQSTSTSCVVCCLPIVPVSTQRPVILSSNASGASAAPARWARAVGATRAATATATITRNVRIRQMVRLRGRCILSRTNRLQKRSANVYPELSADLPARIEPGSRRIRGGGRRAPVRQRRGRLTLRRSRLTC
jgi:hypothetical protein